MANPNLKLLVDAAKLLKPVLGELVFVGGCTTALFITDKAAGEVRPTFDVDAIAEITSYVQYSGFSERLKALGFREDTREGAPLCRWCQETTTLDYFGSPDLEDVIAVVDGRQELVSEIQAARSDVRSYLGREIAQLLDTRKFLDALSGPLPPDLASQERIRTVMARLREISQLR